jgi:hypothetical protein
LTHCPSPHLPHANATESQSPEFEMPAKLKPPYTTEPMATTQIITAMRKALREFKVFSFSKVGFNYKCNGHHLRAHATLPLLFASRQAHGS